MNYNSNSSENYQSNSSYSSNSNADYNSSSGYSGSSSEYKIPVIGPRGICMGTCRIAMGCSCREK